MEKPAFFCGVDVSKHSFSVAIKNGRFVVKDRVFEMNKEGLEGFESIIKGFKESLIVGMEPTGIYHNNLFGFLIQRGYNSVIVNPYSLSQFFRFTNNKPTKTDKKDAKTISCFVEFKKDELIKENHLLKEERCQIRYLVREKERITHLIAQTKTEIKRVLSLVFPEIEKEAFSFSQELLAILDEFGSPERIRAISCKKFVQRASLITPKGRGRNGKLSFEKIYDLAQSSIAQSYPFYEEILKLKIERLKGFLKEKERIADLINKTVDEVFKREIEILTSIPGIGKESAVYLMAEIVDIKRFEGYRKLVGFCGLDPVIKQSGNYKTKWRISKKGNSHARRIAWIMGGCVKRSCPYFREYYLKKRSEGKSYKEAVIATSTKLLRVIYTLLNENRGFK